MSKVRVNVYLNGPTFDAPGNVHGTLKKFVCADLATEMPPEALTFREISYTEGYPRWSINNKDIDMFSIAIDPQYVGDYVLTAGCEPIIDVGITSQQITENEEYNIVSKPDATFTIAAQGTRPDDWYVRGDTKYYIKETKTYNGVSYNVWNPVGFTNPNNQYAPATFDPNETYYITDSPTAMDVYFASNAHFGMVMQIGLEQNYGNYIETRRLFGPSGYNWRPSYPYLSGAMPGLWKSDWEGGHIPGAYTWDYTIPTASVIANTYDYRWKVYMFAHQMNNETYIGFLYTIENGLGIVQAANALIMSPDVAAGVIRTPDGGEISGIEGGQGTYDDSSDNKDPEDDDHLINDWNNGTQVYMPGYHRYVLSPQHAGQFESFTTNLWNPTLWQSFLNTVFKPIEAVITCHTMPHELSPYRDGTYSPIIVAGQDMSNGESVPCFGGNGDMVKYEFPAISIPVYYDAFPDYTNSSIYIHLPYIGTKPLDLSQCMGGQISVVYYAEVFSGDCCAWVYVSDKDGNGRNVYEFKGNCAKEIYLTSRPNTMANWLAVAAPLIPGAAKIANLAVSAGIGLAAGTMSTGGAISEATANGASFGQAVGGLWADRGTFITEGVQQGGTASAMMSNGAPLVDKIAGGIGNVAAAAGAGQGVLNSNGAGGTVTTLTDTSCYLIIERPQWNNPQHYGRLFGYPSDVGGTINMSSDFSGPFEGFLSVRQIELENITATIAERDEITQLLKAGVYVS